MVVRTYTNMWNEEKKLYTIYDITLPTPIGFKQIGLFFLGAILWMPLMAILHVPITHWLGAVSWFSVPVLLAIFGSKKILDGKSIFEFGSSMIGFFLEPKLILDGEGVSATMDGLNVDYETINLKKNSEANAYIDDEEETVKHKNKKDTNIIRTIDLDYKIWTRVPLERN